MASLEGSTKNQAFAALRHFLDALVQRHAVPLNSFASVRGQKHSGTEGKTAELSVEQAKRLLHSIDVSKVVGLRDPAVLGVLAYTGARIGAVASFISRITGTSASNAPCAFARKAARIGRFPFAMILKDGSTNTRRGRPC
jgi:site-specific recombinase XerD